MSGYYINESIRVTQDFTTEVEDTFVEPDTVTFTVTTNGVSVDYVYGVDPEVTKPSGIGLYAVSFTALNTGQHDIYAKAVWASPAWTAIEKTIIHVKA